MGPDILPTPAMDNSLESFQRFSCLSLQSLIVCKVVRSKFYQVVQALNLRHSALGSRGKLYFSSVRFNTSFTSRLSLCVFVERRMGDLFEKTSYLTICLIQLWCLTIAEVPFESVQCYVVIMFCR